MGEEADVRGGGEGEATAVDDVVEEREDMEENWSAGMKKVAEIGAREENCVEVERKVASFRGAETEPEAVRAVWGCGGKKYDGEGEAVVDTVEVDNAEDEEREDDVGWCVPDDNDEYVGGGEMYKLELNFDCDSCERAESPDRPVGCPNTLSRKISDFSRSHLRWIVTKSSNEIFSFLASEEAATIIRLIVEELKRWPRRVASSS